MKEPQNKSWHWLPNALTMSRFVGLVAGIFYLTQPRLGAAYLGFAIFVAVGITDFIDGYLARRLGAISAFGKIMDPIADKAYILSAYFTFVWLGLISSWWVIPIAVREVMVTLLRFRLLAKKQVVAAEKSGKVKALMQNISLVFLFLLYCDQTFWEGTMPVLRHGIFLFAYGTLLASVFLAISSGFSFLKHNRLALCGKEPGSH